jgi:hypothetical protein
MNRLLGGRCGLFRARALGRPLVEQAELADVAPQRRARRRLQADGQQRAKVGRIGLADGGVRQAGRGQLSLQGHQPRAGRAQHDRMRPRRQAAAKEGALASRVDYLGGQDAARQVVPDDHIVMQERLLDRAVTGGFGRGNNLRGAIADVNAS